MVAMPCVPNHLMLCLGLDRDMKHLTYDQKWLADHSWGFESQFKSRCSSVMMQVMYELVISNVSCRDQVGCWMFCQSPCRVSADNNISVHCLQTLLLVSMLSAPFKFDVSVEDWVCMSDFQPPCYTVV